MEQCFAYWLTLDPNWTAWASVAGIAAAIANFVLAWLTSRSVKASERQVELTSQIYDIDKQVKAVFKIGPHHVANTPKDADHLFIVNVDNKPIGIKAVYFKHDHQDDFAPFRHAGDEFAQSRSVIPPGESAPICEASLYAGVYRGPMDNAEGITIRVYFFGRHFESREEYVDVRLQNSIIPTGSMKIVFPPLSASIPTLVPQSPE